MSEQSFSAGQTEAHAEAATEHAMQAAQSAAHAANEQLSNATQSDDSGQAQLSREENASFLQQTGEKMVNMAQGAVDGVKNTLGMGDNTSNNPANTPSNPSN